MKIGFFDSGLGGLTVFNKAIRSIFAEYVYLADNENAPYGVKNKEEVMRYVLSNVKVLADLKCDIIVVACNTATSIAINKIREIYNNIYIIGTEPAVRVAVNENHLNKNILVSATTMTLNEEKLNNLIKNLEAEDIVEKVALDKLVEFAETGETNMDKVKEYLKEQFKNYDLNKFSHIVLGCTHFPLYKMQIKEVIPSHIHIVDGSNGIVKNIQNKIEENNLKYEEKVSVKLLLTKSNDRFIENFRGISKLKNIDVEII